jgi:hypothetical protein
MCGRLRAGLKYRTLASKVCEHDTLGAAFSGADLSVIPLYHYDPDVATDNT